MIFKAVLFLFAIFTIGCGVMNTPNEDGERGPAGDAKLAEEVVLISKIFDGDFYEIDVASRFGFSYKVLDSNLSLNSFSDELNSITPDAKLALWDNKMLNANVNFKKDNILIYTFVSKSCYYEDSILDSEIKISSIKQSCDNSKDISFVYVYKISKKIKQIRVIVDGELNLITI